MHEEADVSHQYQRQFPVERSQSPEGGTVGYRPCPLSCTSLPTVSRTAPGCAQILRLDEAMLLHDRFFVPCLCSSRARARARAHGNQNHNTNPHPHTHTCVGFGVQLRSSAPRCQAVASSVMRQGRLCRTVRASISAGGLLQTDPLALLSRIELLDFRQRVPDPLVCFVTGWGEDCRNGG